MERRASCGIKVCPALVGKLSLRKELAVKDRIAIPKRLEEILERDSDLHGSVILTLSAFHPWIRTSGMPFFPGYTDHSDKHIEEVLSTASSIIADRARQHLGAGDVSVLVLAILLHDAAMHLTEDGFRSLVAPSEQRPRIEGFGDQSWPMLWSEFLGEASRFDGRQLTRIFGDPTPIAPKRIDLENLTERDRLLIGEFVRRHHARLAHEIALWGVPGPSALPLRFREVPDDIADLAGLVARSHNLSIRATYSYLSDKYDLREYRNTHPVFLMAVLRIADYLQVHSERAERELLRVKKLRSPISRQEWNTHFAIRDIRSSHEDPEAIFVDANPTTASLFLKLTGLMKDMQVELDTCWAALGEVYGRYEPLDELGITVRRIRSNLDNPQDFAKRVDFIPVKASFSAAGTDLLKLLIGPLYGNRPEVGVRELIQNATDACREKTDWLTNHAGAEREPSESTPGVLVAFRETEQGDRTLTVVDNGIGMTADVVLNYFLKAGASFRYSEAWRKEHEDDSGRSRILRGGRFGVGALAAFLLGRRITVTTRHISEPPDRAITFVADLEMDALELRYCTAPSGTSICIEITDDNVWKSVAPRRGWNDKATWEHLNWYVLSTPPLKMIWETQRGTEEYEPTMMLPLPNAELPPEWHRFKPAEYEDIHWSYRVGPALTVNGIRVIPYIARELEFRTLWNKEEHAFDIRRPNLSVFDPQGVFPLNLQRTSVSSTPLSFDEELIESIAEDFLAFVLANFPDAPPTDRDADAILETLQHYPGLETYKTFPFLASRSGLMLFDYATWSGFRLQRIYGIPGYVRIASDSFGRLPEDGAFAFFEFNSTPGYLAQWVRTALSENEYKYTAPFGALSVHAARMALSREDWNHIQRPRSIRKSLRDRIIVEWECDDGVIVTTEKGRPPTPPDALARMVDFGLRNELVRMVEWTIPEDVSEKGAPSPIGKAWLRWIRRAVVPFDRVSREQLAAEAIAYLAPAIRYYDDLRKQREEEG